jgi:hypothetical protein
MTKHPRPSDQRPGTWNNFCKFLTLTLLITLGVLSHTFAQSPPPSLKFFLEDVPLDPGAAVAVTQLPLLMLKVVPDSTFAAEHPHDVKYTMHYTLYVRRGSDLGPPQAGSTEALYGKVSSTAKKGDFIAIEMDRIIRTDSVGKTEKILLDKNLKYLSIGVK